MWTTLISSVLPVVLGIGGFFLGGFNERRRDERTFQRESAARAELRSERREEESHKFQLENYLALQDATRDFMRKSVLTSMADRRSLKADGTFRMLPPELSDEAFETSILYGRLLNRVVNDELRGLLSNFSKLSAELAMIGVSAKDLPAADALRLIDRREAELTAAYTELTDKLGALLRSELSWGLQR